MIVLTVSEKDGRNFTVRFQVKDLNGKDRVWRDSEVNHETGLSQAYGIDDNFRLIIEAPEEQRDKSDG
ncbi:hypothetical protein ACNJYD_04415 [Bradyrhizobium sp. DASA03005]|uniref:hypothetical protein n=1 Tax=Bradyrhizobium sp. SPXBL-02 TaxID=3395912 RepID=UPI003F711B62